MISSEISYLISLILYLIGSADRKLQTQGQRRFFTSKETNVILPVTKKFYRIDHRIKLSLKSKRLSMIDENDSSSSMYVSSGSIPVLNRLSLGLTVLGRVQ